ncbi:MAG TPA: polyamine aminopropyltransferase [Sandaracinaceae bacterium LLY-WYZ-13_1]|nr:polyamine aminopropyltransferase [Sandaracinaceae bacterium LLY-WYZ-13_1]
MPAGAWYTEVFEEKTALGLRVKETLHRERSDFQLVEVLDTAWLGKVLVLDGIFMTSVADEFYYHEMIVHPALCTAPRIRRVLVIGGGDGGTAREVLRHPEVERCVMVEIDRRVVEVCRDHLPEIAAANVQTSAWDDPRLELRFEDGVRFVKEADVEPFDAVILDGSDPVGPAEGLFDRSFYEGVRRVLADDGVFALQSESPTVYEDVFFEIQRTASSVFGASHPYFGSVPIYGAGMWTWTLAGRSLDPAALHEDRVEAIADGCRYYTKAIHHAAFAQPAFVARRLG